MKGRYGNGGHAVRMGDGHFDGKSRGWMGVGCRRLRVHACKVVVGRVVGGAGLGNRKRK